MSRAQTANCFRVIIGGREDDEDDDPTRHSWRRRESIIACAKSSRDNCARRLAPVASVSGLLARRSQFSAAKESLREKLARASLAVYT